MYTLRVGGAPGHLEHRRRNRLPAPERRALILVAATEVFSEVGYQRGTMAEVARRVGVTEPVIFQHFGSKAALFSAVLEESTARLVRSMRDGAAGHDSVAEWLTAFLAPREPRHAHGQHAHHVLFADGVTHANEQAVKTAVRQTHRAVADVLADLLRRGQDDGSIRHDLDLEASAWWLLSFLATRGFRATTMPRAARLEAEVAAIAVQALVATRHRPRAARVRR